MSAPIEARVDGAPRTRGTERPGSVARAAVGPMDASAALRVGWCPGALRPMASGDGVILRVKPRSMALPVERAWQIAAAAARHGNGQLDLTGRANLQIRGVSEEGLPALTAELDALGLLDADAGAEARRNVLASPLMGLDPGAAFDARPAVAALEAALGAASDLEGLPSKFGFAVSDGGALPLVDVSADVLFDALPGRRFAVRVDGAPQGRATCAEAEMPGVALRLARAFLDASSARPGLRRMRDLVERVGGDAVLARLRPEGADPAALARLRPEGAGPATGAARRASAGPADPPHPTRAPVGTFPLGSADVLGVAAPFGRLDAARLDRLARCAARAGAVELRLTPWRILLVPGLSRSAAGRLALECAEAGLIVDPADPRLRVAACTGAPGCRRGSTPTLDHAARWSKLVGPGDGIALHVSGCAKGCAHPGPAPLTLVAGEGRYALVVDGSATGEAAVQGLDADEVRRLLRTVLRRDAAS